MKIVAKPITGRNRQAGNGAALRVFRASVGLVNLSTSGSRSVRPMPRLIAFTLVAGSKSPVVPSPLKSIPPTYALNGGALEYEKLSPSSNRQGNRVTPARFRMWVKSVGSGPLF